MAKRKLSRARFKDWRWWASTLAFAGYQLVMMLGLIVYIHRYGDCVPLWQVGVGALLVLPALAVGAVLMECVDAIDKMYEVRITHD